MNRDTLWDSVRVSFETDDGSLPTVEIRDLTAKQVGDIYAMIRRESSLSSQDATFWDARTHSERALDEVENAGALVSSGDASPFHFSGGLPATSGGEPSWVGIHVFQTSVAIDYRMGAEWNGDRVFVFFAWINRLLDGVPGAVLVSDPDEGPPFPEAFLAAWKLFQRV